MGGLSRNDDDEISGRDKPSQNNNQLTKGKNEFKVQNQSAQV